MHLADLIPDADVLLALEPEELALRILPLLDQSTRGRSSGVELGQFLDSTIGDIRGRSSGTPSR